MSLVRLASGYAGVLCTHKPVIEDSLNSGIFIWILESSGTCDR